MNTQEISYTNNDSIQKIYFPTFNKTVEHQQLLSAQLANIIQDISENSEARVVIIDGEEDAFNFQAQNLPAPQNKSELEERQLAQLIANIKCPTIMLCRGPIVGQGFEISLAADIRITNSHAIFIMPQLFWGQLPWDGGTQRLSRLMGIPKSLDLMLTGRIMNSEEAFLSGLIYQRTDSHSIESTGMTLAKQIGKFAPIAMQYTKEAILNGYELPISAGLNLELDLNILLHSTQDRLEGISSFFEKRTPDFKGS